MIALPVQISVASSSVSYLKMLFEAGAISINSSTGQVTLDPDVESKLKDIHELLAAGNQELNDALNGALTTAIDETNELIGGNGMVAYP